MQIIRIGVCCEGVKVGYEKVAVVVILNGNKFAQSAIVVAEVEVSSGADATENYFFFLFRHNN